MTSRWALTGLLAVASVAASAQTGLETPPPKVETAKPAPVKRVSRTLAPRHPQPVRIFRTKPIDIPQWAKDAGHNGSVTYRVAVTADGKMDAAQLVRSSGSSAIDEAALNEIRSASFLRATDKDGNPVAGQTEVYLEYSRWDDESPGGGLDDYRCADLTREYDWFRKVHNNISPPFFALENFYVSNDMLANVEGVDRRDRKAVAKQREKYQKQWLAVVKNCRKRPDALMLDTIEGPRDFRLLVESF